MVQASVCNSTLFTATILSQHYNADPFVISAQVRILFPLRITFQQLPCDFIGNAPVFTRDHTAYDARSSHVLQLFLQFKAQSPASAAGAIAMNQLQGYVFLLPR